MLHCSLLFRPPSVRHVLTRHSQATLHYMGQWPWVARMRRVTPLESHRQALGRTRVELSSAAEGDASGWTTQGQWPLLSPWEVGVRSCISINSWQNGHYSKVMFNLQLHCLFMMLDATYVYSNDSEMSLTCKSTKHKVKLLESCFIWTQQQQHGQACVHQPTSTAKLLEYTRGLANHYTTARICVPLSMLLLISSIQTSSIISKANCIMTPSACSLYKHLSNLTNSLRVGLQLIINKQL